MEQSTLQLQAKLMKDYYKTFSKYTKGKPIEKKVAWVTAFTPVEILETLDILYYYPESYSAVIAASGKEKPLLEESDKQFLSSDKIRFRHILYQHKGHCFYRSRK